MWRGCGEAWTAVRGHAASERRQGRGHGGGAKERTCPEQIRWTAELSMGLMIASAILTTPRYGFELRGAQNLRCAA
jgi:hypothetical protein